MHDGVGRADLREAVLKAGYQIYGDAIYQGYGQTEILPVAMIGPRQRSAKNVPGSQALRACGRPWPFAQLEIRNENNESVPPRKIGEIVAKTECQMQGFWNNP